MARMVSPAPGPAVLSPAPGIERHRCLVDAVRRDPQAGSPNLLPVGPGPIVHRSLRSARQDDVEVFGYPVQIGKIQPPLLPEETLRRDRLLDWLHAKTRSRLALIVAEAGYGKTTLLADWSRQTRVRTLWYRLDEHDRDWAVFIHHIVAAGREIDPDFAPRTHALLRELAANLGNRTTIVRTLLAELQAWAVVGTALVLDDYQQVDDIPEIREIVRELVVRGPDRLAVIISSRTRPTLPLARLRAIGEAAEIGTDDLRFDRVETERLFRDTYRDPLEHDLLDDLARTTEGWAATLRLVESVVHGRPKDEVRAVIRSLSGRHGDLHDYLAEEVVGRMPLPAQDFVERSCLLAVVTPELAAAAAEVTPEAARGFLDVAESAGLMSRRGRTGQAGRLFHPLVRTFLEGRLLDAVGEAAVRQIHARIARVAEPASWSVAAHHYAAAGLVDDAVRVLSASVPVILGSGAYKDAEQLAARLDPSTLGAWHDVIVAGGHLRAGDPDGASDAAARAIDRVMRGDRSTPLAVALSAKMNASYGLGALQETIEWAERVSSEDPGGDHAERAAALSGLVSASLDADLSSTIRGFRDLAKRFEAHGYLHYQGISLLNIAWMLRARGDSRLAADVASRSVEALSHSSAGTEVASAQVVWAWALAHNGDWAGADAKLDASLKASVAGTLFESLLESAEIIGAYDDPIRASQMLEEADMVGSPNTALRLFRDRVAGEQLSRAGLAAEALKVLGSIASDGATGYPAFHVQRLLALLNAHVLATGELDDATWRALESLMQRQGTPVAQIEATVLRGLAGTAIAASAVIEAAGLRDRALLSIRAEAVLSRIADLSDGAMEIVRAEAEARPRRWRPTVRRVLAVASGRARWRAAKLLETIGTKDDVRLLRDASREMKGEYRHQDPARSLARRVADPVYVDDLGRVVIRVGAAEIVGTSIRRKALALLCFLLSQPRMSATRDHVLDALWPDLDPSQAANSLHQTVYFLRRVFEPEYVEDLSPGYLHHDADVVWLDPGLVQSRSQAFRSLAAATGPLTTPDQVDVVSDTYTGKFALDFAYEEWSAPLRDSMHARYLEVMERAVSHEADAGRIDRAIRLAQRALDIDPQLEEVEKSVIRLYTFASAHAAAAEQYGRYSAGQRDLGLDPLRLGDLVRG
jgi:LuxR family maltose regulon positive regulatory protein